MRLQVFLVDYENVQPDVLPALALEEVRVLVFVGPNQTKLPFALVDAVQKLGSKAEYVRVAQQGKDALDMHIAYHLGRLSCELADAYFYIIAKDRDYDPLLLHINTPLVRAAKWDSLQNVPLLRRARATTVPEQAMAVIHWLVERPKKRPATLKTLRNTLIKAVFSGRLAEDEIEPVIELLLKRGALDIDGQKVCYPVEFEAVHAA